MNILNLALFFGGIVLGLLGLYFDEKLFFKYYNSSTDSHLPTLLSRSLLFIAILVPLSIFVVSSTGSPIGQGFVVSMIAAIWFEMLKQRKNTTQFNDRFAQQAKVPLTAIEIEWMFRGMTALLILLVGIILI